jgi:elongation factor P--(R)-beta-lysine ligase
MTPPFWSRAAHADRRPFLQARANLVRAVRAWFARAGFTEVEPAMLVASPGAEVHLNAFEVGDRYLHTSPEFAMKKLLAAGETKIFSLGKVWRRGEEGPLHAPEFTMLEWYRADAPYTDIMADSLALLRLACEATGADALRWRGLTCDPAAPAQNLTLGAAFAELAGFQGDLYAGEIDYFAANGFAPRAGDSWSDLFSRVLVEKIEHRLGAHSPTLLTEYPIAEAALAQRCPADPRRAERFELYACGVELANGFGELTDPAEQRVRLQAAMSEKHTLYGATWPVDEDFLAALAQMPQASGAALGFDRLAMLACGARHIRDVLWTP